ncbi:hypothetical protein HK104_006200, partial [Borealophlyctis nickersoniae]
MARLFLVVAVFLQVFLVNAIDVKTCDESSHCVRNRKIADTQTTATSPYALLTDSVSFNRFTGKVSGLVQNTATKTQLSFSLTFHDFDAARIVITEDKPLHPRYEDTHQYTFQKPLTAVKNVRRTDSASQVSFRNGVNEVVIGKKPFTLTAVRNGEKIVEVNSKGWFNFEQYRKKAPGEDWTEVSQAQDWLHNNT